MGASEAFLGLVERRQAVSQLIAQSTSRLQLLLDHLAVRPFLLQVIVDPGQLVLVLVHPLFEIGDLALTHLL